jgi:hypothetical protein
MIASATACVRLLAPSLSIIDNACSFAVRLAMPRVSPIRWGVCPLAIKTKTSSSRGVRVDLINA